MEESFRIRAVPSIALPAVGRLAPRAARGTNFSALVWAYLAGGSLLAAGLVLLGNAAWYPHPWHQALASMFVVLLGIAVLGGTYAAQGQSRYYALPLYGACAFLVIALPLARYMPFVYTLAYQRDLESLFPPLWPFSFTVPLFAALLGELLLADREKTSRSLMVAVSILPSSMLMLFSYVIVSAMASSSFIMLPSRTFLALASCIGISSFIALTSVMTTRGMVWPGALLLLATGILLEIGSAYFYGGIPVYWTMDRIWDPYPVWVPFLAGTVPGMLAALLGIGALLNHVFRRSMEPAAVSKVA